MLPPFFHFHPQDTPNKVKSTPKYFTDLLSFFHGNNEEISLIFELHRLTVRTFVEVEKLQNDKTRQINRTELSIDPKDFQSYSIENSGEDIVIPLKETKAICTFADALNQPIAIHFIQAGKPLLFALKYFNYLECEFVLATFGTADQSSQQSDGPKSQSTPNDITAQSSNSTPAHNPPSQSSLTSRLLDLKQENSPFPSLIPPDTPSLAPFDTPGRQSSNSMQSASLSAKRPHSPPSTSEAEGSWKAKKSRIFVTLDEEEEEEGDE